MTTAAARPGPVALACTHTGLYLAGRPADLLLALRRLSEAAVLTESSQAGQPTLQRLLASLVPPT
jgi:hypothetical protein